MAFFGIIITLIIAGAISLVVMTIISSRKMYKVQVAKEAIKEKNWSKLIKISNEMIKKNNNAPLPYYWMAMAYKKKRHYIKAYDYLKIILNENLYNEDFTERALYNELATIAEKLGNEEDALKFNNYLLNQGLADHEVFLRMGKIYFEKENYRNALRYFTDVVKHDKYYAKVYPYLGITLFKLSNKSKALQYLKAAAGSVSEFPEINYYLGEIYFTQNDFTNAKPLFQQCFENNIEKAASCGRLGDILMEDGKSKEAIEKYESALELGGLDEEWSNSIRYQLATAYNKLPNINKAIDLWKEIQRSDSSYKDTNTKLECYIYLNAFQKNGELTRVYSLNTKGFGMQCEIILKKMGHHSISLKSISDTFFTAVSRYSNGAEEYDCLSYFNRKMQITTEKQTTTLDSQVREDKHYCGKYFSWYIFALGTDELNPTSSIELYDGEKISKILKK